METPVTTFRLPSEIKNIIDTHAKDNGVTRTDSLCQIVLDWYDYQLAIRMLEKVKHGKSTVLPA